MGEVPVIGNSDELHAAAEVLAHRNAAYVVADTLDSPFGPVTDRQQKIGGLVHNLNEISRDWVIGRSASRVVDAASDIGMHGNPYVPGSFSDYLHYHETPAVNGKVQVTFAKATPDYMRDQGYANRRLTELLAEDKTDSRYADPESFQRVVLGVGGAVLFRLNEGRTGLPLLHSFDTVGGGRRIAEITPIYKVGPGEAVAHDEVDEFLALMRRILGRRLTH